MNAELLRYKSRFITIVLLLGYAFLHTRLTGVYLDAPLQEMMDFTVRLPFAQRLLVPALAHGLSAFLPLRIDSLFFLLEWLFISLFYFALKALLAMEFRPRLAQLLSWLFILILPLTTVINYRYTNNGVADFYYPCDTASLFFIAVGLIFCLRKQWLYFIPWVFLATFNRESSILLVLLIPALHWQTLGAVLRPMVMAMIAYLLGRLLILSFLQGVPGSLMECYFEANLNWLLNQQHLLLFMFCFAGLPLFWFAFYDYIPLRYRPLRFVLLFYLLGLLFVGMFREARIFTEIIILMYLPVCLALSRWLAELEPIYPACRSGLLYFVNRYLVLASLVSILVCRPWLVKLVNWLSHYV